MPAPVVYVVGAVATVATGYAFYRFVYEPHIAPHLEVWAQSFLDRRREARNRRQPIPVPVPSDSSSDHDDDAPAVVHQSSYELESLINREVDEWRSQVDLNQGGSGLRNRRTAQQPENSTRFVPMNNTHVLFDPSQPPTPSSATRHSPAANAFPLPTPASSHPPSPPMSHRSLDSLSSAPAPRIDVRSMPSAAASAARSPSIGSADIHTISDIRSPSVMRSPFELFNTAVEGPSPFDNPIASPPPQLPRSDTSLSDLELLSAHSQSIHSDLSDETDSVLSWESGNISPRLR